MKNFLCLSAYYLVIDIGGSPPKDSKWKDLPENKTFSKPFQKLIPNLKSPNGTVSGDLEVSKVMQTWCRITGGDVVGSELAMLPLNVKSKEWQQRPLIGSQVHVSNQVDDLTTTPDDFMFHPELLACPVLRYDSSISRNLKVFRLFEMRLPPMLETLEIQGCPILESLPEGMMQNNTTLQSLSIMHCDSLSCDSLTSFPLAFFTKLETLDIWGCTNLESLYIPDGFHHVDLTSLQYLLLWMHTSLHPFNICIYLIVQKLIRFPKGFTSNLSSFTSGIATKLVACRMESLWIGGHKEERLSHFLRSNFCPPLSPLLQLGLFQILNPWTIRGFSISSLETLYILNCEKLKSFPKHGLPSSFLVLILVSVRWPCSIQALAFSAIIDSDLEVSEVKQTQCRITNVVGAERAMLQLIMKSKKWQQSPLLGYQVHISNQLDDLTSTLADFLFHPEGFSYYWHQNCVHVQFFGLLTVSIRTMFPNICCAQKASYASPTILPLTKLVSSS
ncbi:hypothetical protein AAG906_021866 [Vitis piasezkii]